jgi:dolichol phosphate-mannose biosynthesis regulatory protein
MITVALAVFLYYTMWTVVTPFIDPSEPLQAFFPERRWAILLPAYLFVGVLVVAGTFIGSVMIASGKKRK